MPLQRRPHWAERHFHAFLLERAAVPYAWGRHDCATFSADGIACITGGVDIMADLRGYTSADEAYRKIKAVTGGASLADAFAWCAAKHGLQEWPSPLLAQRGDLVLYEEHGRLIAGLVHLNGREVVSPGEHGLLRIPLAAVRRAWRY